MYPQSSTHNYTVPSDSEAEGEVEVGLGKWKYPAKMELPCLASRKLWSEEPTGAYPRCSQKQPESKSHFKYLLQPEYTNARLHLSVLVK